MLSRRALLLTAAAASTLVPALAHSQPAPSARPGGGSEPQTVLRLLRRTIEVKGKSASVYGIQQPDGAFGLRTSYEIGGYIDKTATTQPIRVVSSIAGIAGAYTAAS